MKAGLGFSKRKCDARALLLLTSVQFVTSYSRATSLLQPNGAQLDILHHLVSDFRVQHAHLHSATSANLCFALDPDPDVTSRLRARLQHHSTHSADISTSLPSVTSPPSDNGADVTTVFANQNQPTRPLRHKSLVTSQRLDWKHSPRTRHKHVEKQQAHSPDMTVADGARTNRCAQCSSSDLATSSAPSSAALRFPAPRIASHLLLLIATCLLANMCARRTCHVTGL